MATDDGADSGTLRFRGLLSVEAADGTPSKLPLTRLELAESYNAGWRGRAVMAQRVRPGMSSSVFMGSMMAAGALPGAKGTVFLTLRRAGGGNDLILRSWPVGLGAIEPKETGDESVAACTIGIMDPVTYLEDRPVWGAYRGCSAGEIFGGVVSMAAGGSGKPTLTPALPGLPPMTITASHRESLNWMQYAIAAGQPLGEWLGEVVGLLGLRIEMTGSSDGGVGVHLTDMQAMAEELPSRVAGVWPADGGKPDQSRTPFTLTGMYGQPTVPIRASVLDDVTQGAFRRVGRGSVGSVVEALGIGPDEVAARLIATRRGRDAERFALSATTMQPGCRPGRVANFDIAVRGVAKWQVAGVRHHLSGDSYDNDVTLFNALFPWAPEQPAQRPDIVVPAAIDGGEQYKASAPVPRDRMGRIPVRFPFLPAETAEDAATREAGDRDGDGDVEMDDFTADEFGDTAHWQQEAEALRSNALRDPFPGRGDGELTSEELARRQALANRRRGARRYIAYLGAKEREEADRDHDGYVTRRDALVSDRLGAALGDEHKRAQIEEWDQAMRMGTLEEDFPDISEEDALLVAEYGGLFGPEAGRSDDLTVLQAAADVDIAAQKWPPLLPLPVVNPMAGRMHGFIPSHRQGDACRVAIHGPFSAEVIGFQYRDDRPINAQIEGATAGLVVEHDHGGGWTGLVFRPTDEVEE